MTPVHTYITKEETGGYEGPLIDGMRPDDYHDHARMMKEINDTAERVFGPSQEFMNKIAEAVLQSFTDNVLNPKVVERPVRPPCLIDDHLYDLTTEHNVSDGWESTYRYEALEAVIDFYEAKIKELCTS